MAKLMSPLSEAGRTVGWADTVTPPHFSPISRSSDQNRNPQQSLPTGRDGGYRNGKMEHHVSQFVFPKSGVQATNQNAA